jgi:hypothetical protein
MGIHPPERNLGMDGAPAEAWSEAELSRLAREVVAGGQRVIGVAPASSGIRCLAACSALAEALAAFAPGSIAVIDADGSNLQGAARDAAEPQVMARWLAPRVALLGPVCRPAAGHAAGVLRKLVRYADARAGATVIDLSGLESGTELASAFVACDGVVLVAHAGRTRQRDLEDAAALVGNPLLLGVLLTK